MSVIEPALADIGHDAQVVVTTRGRVPAAMVEYAGEKVARVRRYTPQPIRAAHVVLTLERDPARERPAIAEVELEVDGTHVRAQAETPTLRETVDLLADRLQEALVRHRDRTRTRRRSRARQAKLAARDVTPATEG
jgi:ribosomal subunit interface protein